MVYFMEIYCDGGCRGNGYAGAYGAAAMFFKYPNGRHEIWDYILPNYPPPTNQRAELHAIILSLEIALRKGNSMNPRPWLNVTIKTDSQYVVNCVTVWKNTWLNNGWRNAQGGPVLNRDLIEEALRLESQLRNVGQVNYQWIPREQNVDADRYCNNAMDQKARRRQEASQQYEYY
ncbi:ribonuclease H1 [Acephala macrosclerotiorum]|nr:ribonuclease H1 [Acephala macrosclerotiorum]